MNMEQHEITRCQEHATLAGGDITQIIKPPWPIRSLTQVTLQGGFTVYTSGSQIQSPGTTGLHNNTV